jgi:hypothetical protein
LDDVDRERRVVLADARDDGVPGAVAAAERGDLDAVVGDLTVTVEEHRDRSRLRASNTRNEHEEHPKTPDDHGEPFDERHLLDRRRPRNISLRTIT